MKTAAELNNQREMDSDILAYVRAMQQLAPVTAESIEGFLTIQRRRRVTRREVQDRIDYLVSAGYLQELKEWQAGEFRHYKITAPGMDMLDGNAPPPGWKP